MMMFHPARPHRPARVFLRRRARAIAAGLALLIAGLPAWPALAQDGAGQASTATLTDRVKAMLDAPAIAGTRWGVLVTDMKGREIVAINPDQRFVPASNTKMFTTAAAYALMPDLDQPDRVGGAVVRLIPRRGGAPDVVLTGNGDAALSDRPDCRIDCLQTLARAVAAAGIRRVHDVIGDDTRFPDERWGAGWRWDDLKAYYGTAVSALTLDDNSVGVTVSPGPRSGALARIALADGDHYLAIRNTVRTVVGGQIDLRIARRPGSRAVRLYGTIPLGAEPKSIALGIDDPAAFAALHFRRLLAERGVRVIGKTRARHRPVTLADDADAASAPGPSAQGRVIARLVPPPLGQDIRHLLKVSQNLHAELLLRRLGRLDGIGSVAQGSAARARVLTLAGIQRGTVDLADGSGMSTDNRITPRAAVTLLRWIGRQPWGDTWRTDLPVAGVDGTLANRFRDTPLQGKLFAKTGTLGTANALSGYLIAASGKRLVFSVLANDRPSAAPSVLPVVDAALCLIAAEN